jgi:hypothetical protein
MWKNKNYTHGIFGHLGDTEFYERLRELSDSCNDVSVFKFENRYFSGNYTQTIKQYLLENPSKSFYVWLSDNGLEVTQSDGKN